MLIDGEKYKVEASLDHFLTVPDCMVMGSNKLGKANGEAKLYIASKDAMRNFFGDAGFDVECILLRSDLINYMYAIKDEYLNPTFAYGYYYNQKRKTPKLLSDLWQERLNKVLNQEEVISFHVQDQIQIQGNRGYINSDEKGKGYDLLREVALPLCSFLVVYKLQSKIGHSIYYMKLFVDFDMLANSKKDPLVFVYGKKNEEAGLEEIPTNKDDEINENIKKARNGQGKYREQLLKECVFCPFTRISDERLLVASHIKPWVISTDEEKVDPKNGFLLSPLYDKLFDKGFITFTPDKRVHLSAHLSSYTYNLIGLKDNQFIEALPMDDRREEYLEYHRNAVFNGILNNANSQGKSKYSFYKPYLDVAEKSD